MQPIQQLLNRIRWDRDFAVGRFEIAYYDRLEKRLVRVPFQTLRFTPGEHFSFALQDSCGEEHTIPFHRVHQVFKDGRLIWERPL